MPLSKITECISLLNTADLPDHDKAMLQQHFLEIKKLLQSPYNEAKAEFFVIDCFDHLLHELAEAHSDISLDVVPRVTDCTEAILDLLYNKMSL